MGQSIVTTTPTMHLKQVVRMVPVTVNECGAGITQLMVKSYVLQQRFDTTTFADGRWTVTHTWKDVPTEEESEVKHV